MQQLSFDPDASTKENLVLLGEPIHTTTPTTSEDGEEQPATEITITPKFTLPVTDELLQLLGAPTAAEVAAEQARQQAEAQAKAEAEAEARRRRSQLTPLALRPPQIQEKVRQGLAPAEVAELAGCNEARIAPYVKPVMIERNYYAEVAKKAVAFLDERELPLPLWQAIARGFTQTGNDLSAAEWTAFKDPAGNWIARLSWYTGVKTREATWLLQQPNGHASAFPSNPEAIDLLERSLMQPAAAEPEPQPAPVAPQPEEPPAAPEPQETAAEPEFALAQEEEPAPKGPAHPDPQRPKRKNATPHWEDVLLGLRSSTKRPPR